MIRLTAHLHSYRLRHSRGGASGTGRLAAALPLRSQRTSFWTNSVYSRLAQRQLQNKDVTVHDGTSRDFLGRYQQRAAQAVQQGEDGLQEIGVGLLEYIADTRNLRCAWDYLAEHGGYAPGPNGLRYDDLEQAEIWDLLRTLSDAITRDTYRPGPSRAIRIPKSSGHGHRTLRLQNIEDRVVQRGIVQIIQPLLDPAFDNDSYGFRPGRDRQHALATADYLTTECGFDVWVSASTIIEGVLIRINEGRMIA